MPTRCVSIHTVPLVPALVLAGLICLAPCWRCAALADERSELPGTDSLLEGELADPVSLSEWRSDSLSILQLEPELVSGDRVARARAGAELRLDVIEIRDRAEASVAELASLLPSTRLGVNSRGESQFMLRGASERHLQVYLAGMPLTLPWDERADLSLLPLLALGSVELRRGAGSALEASGALAGVLRLRYDEPDSDTWRTRLSCQAASGGLRELGALQLWRPGAWRLTAAGAYRRRDGFPRPGGWVPASNEGDGDLRLNSDLEQSSLSLRLARPLPDDGLLAFTLLASRAEKGVPPEAHLGLDARFWRYPDSRRLIYGLSLHRGVDPARLWYFSSDLSLDFARQEIRLYDGVDYDSPALAPGVEQEIGRDRTLHLALRLSRVDRWERRLALGVRVRHARHLETLVAGGPEYAYAQVLGSCGVEYSWPPRAGWRLGLGAARDFVTTPDTGDKPPRDAQGAGVWYARADRRWGRLRSHLALSRRGRFPSLRESYSGAFGKFIPNPELGPELQNMVELGCALDGRRVELALDLFMSRIEGGIEKERNEDGSFSRINVDELRALGCELALAWRPLSGLALTLQHGIFRNRRKSADGDFDLPVEDRPEFISFLSLAWTHPRGLRLRVECSATGSRQSSDATDAVDGLRALPARSKWSLRAAWLSHGLPGPARGAEIYLRLDNLLDETVISQTGLPEPGRVLRLGLNLELTGG